MRSPARYHFYLGHILEAIERIERYTEEMDSAAFMQDSLVQDAVIRNLEIIGEASHSIIECCPRFVDEHPELPLRVAYQMRNVIAHGYFKVNLSTVWNTLEKDLPEMPSPDPLRLIRPKDFFRAR